MKALPVVLFALLLILTGGCDAYYASENKGPAIEFVEPFLQDPHPDTLSGTFRAAVRATDDWKLEYVRIQFVVDPNIPSSSKTLFDWTNWFERGPMMPNASENVTVERRDVLVDTTLTLPVGIKLVRASTPSPQRQYSIRAMVSDGHNSASISLPYVEAE